MRAATRVALGLRSHSGWAALVALAGPTAAPAVVGRQRLLLCDGSFPRQPYHAAEGIAAGEAEALVSRSLDTARRLAGQALAAAAEEHRRVGRAIAGAGLLLGSGRPLPSELAAILGSHPLIHTAEGEMYRDVLRAACDGVSIEVVGFRERAVEALACEQLKLSAGTLRTQLAALGKPLGAPWGQDQKLAALAAWLVLARARG
jgi:hypothetical protein